MRRSPALTASIHASHICESMTTCCVAAVAARPESARAMADADCASDWAPLHWLAWNDAHAVATAAIARMIAVHESRMR